MKAAMWSYSGSFWNSKSVGRSAISVGRNDGMTGVVVDISLDLVKDGHGNGCTCGNVPLVDGPRMVTRTRMCAQAG